ncbi:MAG: DsbA family oxidoreductase [Xanthomonadales bacterium]|nr:DsbA family oxidoreductase [Xanthomonadales bacterium]
MATQARRVRIDFVSDVACPWCAVGLKSVQEAVRRLEGAIEPDWHFQPFELNAELPAAGADATQILMLKYRIDAAQVAANRATIRERAAALGFAYNVGPGSRAWNTFDAHRLLHWAKLEGHQLALKEILLRAYFTDGENVSDPSVLQRLAVEADLDGERAAAILAGDEYAAEVRAQEEFYTSRGIRSVPATIFDGRHMIPGGQPPEVFEEFLRELAAGRLDAPAP